MHSRYRISGQIDLTVSLPGYPILGFFQKLLNFDTPAWRVYEKKERYAILRARSVIHIQSGQNPMNRMTLSASDEVPVAS